MHDIYYYSITVLIYNKHTAINIDTCHNRDGAFNVTQFHPEIPSYFF